VAAAKRFTTEQIVAKLREAEKLQAQGLSIPALCKRLQISDQTFYRWRLKYGALKEDTAIDTPAGVTLGLIISLVVAVGLALVATLVFLDWANSSHGVQIG
jgi:hypothetical protein